MRESRGRLSEVGPEERRIVHTPFSLVLWYLLPLSLHYSFELLHSTPLAPLISVSTEGRAPFAPRSTAPVNVPRESNASGYRGKSAREEGTFTSAVLRSRLIYDLFGNSGMKSSCMAHLTISNAS